jgi:hypothetical protein
VIADGGIILSKVVNDKQAGALKKEQINETATQMTGSMR